ncbi:MAG: pyrroloquinoline quinone biosynthesis protein PqqB [Acidobacteria bacterium]|nr:pyrroloquinoline quinone biosynthesis protein PqqB [Acidobacteriota bacterium]
MFAIRATVAAEAPFVVVLGVAQDAGVPQIGCESPFCQRAWKDASLRRRVASLALVDPAAKKRWLFDATPDFPAQFETLKEVTGDYSNGLAGIFLTHAHIGHYTGLMYLGRESMNAREIKVYAMPRMKSMLETNAPWSQLVGLKNIALEPLAENRGVELGDGLVIEAARVPHRDEFSETVGYWIGSGRKSLAYVPDIDKWQKWELPLDEVVRSNDYVLIDGTFYADGEIARPMSEVPHPFVTETMSLLKDLPPDERTKVFFIHFNHTNPLVQGDREKIREVEKNGFHIAFEGQRFSLR